MSASANNPEQPEGEPDEEATVIEPRRPRPNKVPSEEDQMSDEAVDNNGDDEENAESAEEVSLI